MAISAFTVPVLANKTGQFKAFVGELTGARKADFAASRKKLGVRERTFHQQTPQGDFVIVTLEGDNPEAASTKLGLGTDPFTVWFRSAVKDIHGVDLDAPPPGPPPELIADSGP